MRILLLLLVVLLHGNAACPPGSYSLSNMTGAMQCKGYGFPSLLALFPMPLSAHTCVLWTTTGPHSSKVSCWGSNSYGELGLGHTNPIVDGAGEMGQALESVLAMSGYTTATGGASGGQHACAVLNDTGNLVCWGRNLYGLATGLVTPPVAALQVACGNNFTCVLLSNHTIACWGQNSQGQMGIGHTNDVTTGPSQRAWGSDPSLTQVSVVACGSAHICASLSSGVLYCWSFNNLGQLGRNSGESQDRLCCPPR